MEKRAKVQAMGADIACRIEGTSCRKTIRKDRPENLDSEWQQRSLDLDPVLLLNPLGALNRTTYNTAL